MRKILDWVFTFFDKNIFLRSPRRNQIVNRLRSENNVEGKRYFLTLHFRWRHFIQVAIERLRTLRKKSHENKITMTVYGSYNDRFTFEGKKSFQREPILVAKVFLPFFSLFYFILSRFSFLFQKIYSGTIAEIKPSTIDDNQSNVNRILRSLETDDSKVEVLNFLWLLHNLK